jgi:hypothetical protein
MATLKELATGTAKPRRFTKANPAIKPSHEGLLHADLGISKDKKIPEARLRQAEHARDPKIRKRAIFAETMKGWKHGG